MNAAVNQYWESITQKFEALNVREKRLVLGAVLCIFYGIYAALIEPVSAKLVKINSQVQENDAQRHSLELQLNVLTQKKRNKKESPEQQKINVLNKNIDALSDKIETLKSALINPQSVPDLLSDLLKEDEQLRLVSLKTMPAAGLFDDSEAHAHQSHALPVFKHGVEITIEGRYLDLVRYLEKLEQMPWHILWEKADIEVEKNPKTALPLSQLTLVVYSLSLEKNLLTI